MKQYNWAESGEANFVDDPSFHLKDKKKSCVHDRVQNHDENVFPSDGARFQVECRDPENCQLGLLLWNGCVLCNDDVISKGKLLI